MYAYIVYRIALSLHLEIFLGLSIAIFNTSMNIELVVFIAIFADIATLAIAYDNAPYSKFPVKWNLPKLWGMSIVMGTLLAAGTWITLILIMAPGGGIVSNHASRDTVLFLQITLTENWLIFLTRTDGRLSRQNPPSWKLVVAILAVDVTATLMTYFGVFLGGQGADLTTIAKVWAMSFGMFCVMAAVYRVLCTSTAFENLVHGRRRKDERAQELTENLRRESSRQNKVV